MIVYKKFDVFIMNGTMGTNCLSLILFRNTLFYCNIKSFEILMLFFYKCITIKVTEQILNPIIVFTANLKILKNESKKVQKYEVTGVVINMKNTTLFEQFL